jgi:hypothetical protein
VSKGAKEISSGRVWAAGFHHVTARSRLAGVLKLTNSLLLSFQNFFLAAVTADTGARLYVSPQRYKSYTV